MQEDLARFVAVPSVSADPARAQDVRRSADLVATAFREVGVPVSVAAAPVAFPLWSAVSTGRPASPRSCKYRMPIS
jgi:acetylornithine deacetylase/succinyl-diaminopimelate desuccinylase-like protein